MGAAPGDLCVLLIRHAEKPVVGQAGGVDERGLPSDDSLSPRGWQRAGALVTYFGALGCDPAQGCIPDAVFAARGGEGIGSFRSVQTAAPVAAGLALARPTPFLTNYSRDEIDALVADVRSRAGCVLVVWEHQAMAAIVGRLTEDAISPQPWDRDCFDRLWRLDRRQERWAWQEHFQRLLPGDAG